MAAYAIVDPSNNVINMVSWDGVALFNVSPNTLVAATGQPNAQIGGTYVGGVFTAPVVSPTPSGIFFLNSPVSGANINIPSPIPHNNSGFRKLYIWLTPASALAALTFTMSPNPQDGDDYYLKSSFAIAALTLALPPGTTLFNFSSPASISANNGYHICYSAQQRAWFLF